MPRRPLSNHAPAPSTRLCETPLRLPTHRAGAGGEVDDRHEWLALDCLPFRPSVLFPIARLHSRLSPLTWAGDTLLIHLTDTRPQHRWSDSKTASARAPKTMREYG